ncbi:MAG TPA: FMN-binding protein [Patescibacteria group bacterium]|nr:FMN-binding protein [Patescibacteria group bacterium]
MKNKIVIIAGTMLGIAAIGFGIFYFTYLAPLNETYKEIRTMAIEEVSMDNSKDGVYQGEYSYSSTTCKVEVVVRDHKIADIKVLSSGKSEYAKKAEAVLDKVIEKQTLQVDVVAGATTTSKALLKATENALKKGIR